MGRSHSQRQFCNQIKSFVNTFEQHFWIRKHHWIIHYCMYGCKICLKMLKRPPKMFIQYAKMALIMSPHLGTGGIMFSSCPSVRSSEAWNALFPPVHGSVGPSDQPWPFRGMSVRPERFPGICRRTHGGNGLKFCMLVYLGHLQNGLDYGLGLLIFLLLSPVWHNEMGQIWSFWAFPRERMRE